VSSGGLETADDIGNDEQATSGAGSKTAHDIGGRATPLRPQGNNSDGRGERAEVRCEEERVW
jgi:hypothetical protein